MNLNRVGIKKKKKERKLWILVFKKRNLWFDLIWTVKCFFWFDLISISCACIKSGFGVNERVTHRVTWLSSAVSLVNERWFLDQPQSLDLKWWDDDVCFPHLCMSTNPVFKVCIVLILIDWLTVLRMGCVILTEERVIEFECVSWMVWWLSTIKLHQSSCLTQLVLFPLFFSFELKLLLLWLGDCFFFSVCFCRVAVLFLSGCCPDFDLPSVSLPSFHLVFDISPLLCLLTAFYN